VTLRAPIPAGGGTRRSSTPVAPNSGAVPFNANVAPAARLVTATINSRSDDPRNGAGFIHIGLTTNATLPTPKAPLLDGEWEIHLQNVLPRSARVDLYIDNGDDAPKFTSHATRAGSITTPGTAKMVATVAAYAPQKSFLFFDWSGDLTSFSSFGPTRDGDPKPNIAAPGSKVTSTRAGEQQHCCCNCCMAFYTDRTAGGHDFQGTSMAAPHVTGTIALMFEKDPTLHALDILQILGRSALAPQVSHGTLPDTQWGAGRLNAFGAVDVVGAPPPVPGPPVTPPHLSGQTGPAPASVPSARPRRASVPIVRASARGRLVHVPSGGREPPALWTSTALQSPTAQQWAALVSRHFSEVRGLVNNQRKAATCWHRLGGPQLLNAMHPALAGSGILTIHDDPAALAIWQARAHRFLDVLERLGSAELAGAVRQHRGLLTADVNLVVDQIFALSGH
jgi:hypothetical protein